MKLTHTNIQTTFATLAFVVSIMATWFAWQQVVVSQTHNKLSVLPILQITPYLEGENGRNGLYISNDGLGPATIKSFSVKSNGATASGFEADRWAEVLSATNLDPNCFATAWPKREATLKAGDSSPLLYVADVANKKTCLLEMVRLIGGNPIYIAIDYESIYKEKRHLSADSKIFSKTLDSLYQKLN